MKNVHFTIELQDGIAITGDDPVEVKQMLYKMHDAFYEACEHYREKRFFGTLKIYDEWFWAVNEAINTIEASLQTKEI